MNRLSPPATSTPSLLWQRAATNRSGICSSARWIQLHRGFCSENNCSKRCRSSPGRSVPVPSVQRDRQHLVAARKAALIATYEL